MQLGGDQTCSQLCISAISPPVSSAIQDEAFSLLLATHLAGLLQLQRATFLTDSATLAKATAAQNLHLTPGHWTIRPQLSQMTGSPAFDASRIHHIPRSDNIRAHHQAQLALRLQNRSPSFMCLVSSSERCLNGSMQLYLKMLSAAMHYCICTLMLAQ